MWNFAKQKGFFYFFLLYSFMAKMSLEVNLRDVNSQPQAHKLLQS